MINYKLIAIKIGETVKYVSSYNEINRIAQAVFPFSVKNHPNDSITSARAQLVYDWIMTLSEQNIAEEQKEKLLDQFIKELGPEFAQSKIIEEANSRDTSIDEIRNDTEVNTSSDEIFMLMPFEGQFKWFYSNAVEPVVKLLGYKITKADDNLKIGTIIEQIKNSIKNARLVIADVTGRNPNVFYELGLAHGYNKKVLILTQKDEDIPFDIKHIRYFSYKMDTPLEITKEKLMKILKENL